MHRIEILGAERSKDSQLHLGIFGAESLGVSSVIFSRIFSLAEKLVAVWRNPSCSSSTTGY